MIVRTHISLMISCQKVVTFNICDWWRFLHRHQGKIHISQDFKTFRGFLQWPYFSWLVTRRTFELVSKLKKRNFTHERRQNRNHKCYQFSSYFMTFYNVISAVHNFWRYFIITLRSYLEYGYLHFVNRLRENSTEEKYNLFH